MKINNRANRKATRPHIVVSCFRGYLSQLQGIAGFSQLHFVLFTKNLWVFLQVVQPQSHFLQVHSALLHLQSFEQVQSPFLQHSQLQVFTQLHLQFSACVAHSALATFVAKNIAITANNPIANFFIILSFLFNCHSYLCNTPPPWGVISMPLFYNYFSNLSRVLKLRKDYNYSTKYDYDRTGELFQKMFFFENSPA